MKTARLLTTVAAAALLTAGAALAQSPDKDKAATPAPAAQQKAPAEKQAAPMHSEPGMKADEGKSTQNKADVKHETTGQAPKAEDSKAPAAKTEMKSEPNAAKPMDKSSEAPKATDTHKAETKPETKADTKATQTEQKPAATQSTETKPAAGSATTGQGAAAGSAKLSTEQRTRISTVIKQQKVERIEPSKLNVSISVGVRLPATVHYYPMPTEVITIYPEWRGYDYILVGDQIIVVDPRSHEIVAILDA